MKDIARGIAKRNEKEKKKGSGAARFRGGVPRACFGDDATGGCSVHDGDAVSGACNLKSSQGKLFGPAKPRTSQWGDRVRREKEKQERGERLRRNYNRGTPPARPQSASLHILARQCSKLPRNSPCNHPAKSNVLRKRQWRGASSTRHDNEVITKRGAPQFLAKYRQPIYSPLAGGEHLARLTQVTSLRLSSLRQTLNRYSANLYMQHRE